MTRRVVITGMGTVNALSLDLMGYWRALLEGRSGVGLIEQFDATSFKVKIAGEVKGFHPDPVIDARTLRRLDRFTQFAMVAAAEAVKDCGIDFEKELSLIHI